MIDLYQLHSVGTSADLDRVPSRPAVPAKRSSRRAAGRSAGSGSPAIRARSCSRRSARGSSTRPSSPSTRSRRSGRGGHPRGEGSGAGTICMKPLAGERSGAARSRSASSSRAAWTSSSRGWTRWSRSRRTPRPERGSRRAGRRGARRARGREKALGGVVLPPLRLLPALPERSQHPVSLSHRRLLHPLRAHGLGARAALGASEEVRRLHGVRRMPREMPVRAPDPQ